MGTRRVTAWSTALLLVASGCVSPESEPPATTARATTTTAAATTTTTTTTTMAATTTQAGVTTHPSLPNTEPIDGLRWDAVGPGWHLALVDASDIGTATSGPTVLYIAAPDGTRYEAANLGTPSAVFDIADWRGHEALLISGAGDGLEVEVLELRSGAVTASFPVEGGDWCCQFAGFLWTGSEYDILVYTDNGQLQNVERIDRTGQVVALIAAQPTPDDYRDSLTFLPGDDGTIVVGGSEGLRLVTVDGAEVTDLSTPEGRCVPVRWWDPGTVVVTCGQPAPNDSYGRVWLVPTDGTQGVALTEAPQGQVEVVDFGYQDAWPAGDTTLAQWRGDCGAALIENLTTGLRIGDGQGSQLVDVVDDTLYVHEWGACDGSSGRLVAMDLSGVLLAELVPNIGDSFGVRDVIGYR